jgi:hypothetical protein
MSADWVQVFCFQEGQRAQKRRGGKVVEEGVQQRMVKDGRRVKTCGCARQAWDKWISM